MAKLKLTKSQTYNPAAPAKYKHSRKTISEELHSEDFLRWIFPDEKNKFYYCHVNLDWQEIPKTPPDVFSMAYEAGLNLAGINVAIDTYIMTLNSGQWTYQLPHYYFVFNSPEKYKKNQQRTFDSLSALIPMIAEDLYMSGYYISLAGGGLGVWVPLIIEWEQSVIEAEQTALNILHKLNRSKEFYFVEYGMADPVYNSMMFNNLTYEPRINSYDKISDDPNKWIGVNQNFFNPQRFEALMKPSVDAIYPSNTDIATIREQQRISVYNTVEDTLKIQWVKAPVGTGGPSDWTVNGVNFSQRISENREMQNMILKYINKPVNDIEGDATTEYWVIKGDSNLEQFFRAGSQFIWHPVITNYLYNVYMRDTGQQVGMRRQLWPHLMKSQAEWESFCDYWKVNYSYGNALGSYVANQLQTKLTSIVSGK